MHEDLPEVVYAAESELRRPLQFFRGMWRDLFHSRELAWRLFVRDVNAMYRQTALGYLWAFLPPLAVTLTFVFLSSQKIFRVGETAIPYPAYVMIGTLLWQVFVDAMQSPLRIIEQSRTFLAKINFPREALIISGVLEAVFSVCIRMALLIGVFLWYGLVPPPSALFAPLGVAAIIGLGLMFGLLLVPIGVLYRDVQRGLTLVVGVWFFLTPVVYPPPTTWPASLLSSLNPVSPLLVTTRRMLTTGEVHEVGSFLATVGLTCVLLLVAWVWYRLALPHIIERMSA